MPEITIEVKFCYGHRLHGYAGKCNRLHGHNAKLQVTFQRETLNSEGFVVDFATAKQFVNQHLDLKYDHYMLLQISDPIVQVLVDAGEDFMVMQDRPTAENIAALLKFELQHELSLTVWDKVVAITRVCLWETDACSVEV